MLFLSKQISLRRRIFTDRLAEAEAKSSISSDKHTAKQQCGARMVRVEVLAPCHSFPGYVFLLPAVPAGEPCKPSTLTRLPLPLPLPPSFIGFNCAVNVICCILRSNVCMYGWVKSVPTNVLPQLRYWVRVKHGDWFVQPPFYINLKYFCVVGLMDLDVLSLACFSKIPRNIYMIFWLWEMSRLLELITL